jgi:hypothetical protein
MLGLVSGSAEANVIDVGDTDRSSFCAAALVGLTKSAAHTNMKTLTRQVVMAS